VADNDTYIVYEDSKMKIYVDGVLVLEGDNA